MSIPESMLTQELIPEPMLTQELEDDHDTSPAGYARILQALAGQLGPMNDYYMALMDVAKMLDGKNSRTRLRHE